MSENEKAVRASAQLKLERKGVALTPEGIHTAVLEAIDFIGCDDVDADRVAAELETVFQTVIGQERKLVGEDEGYEPWLLERRTDIDWAFWNRYEQFLTIEKHWPRSTVDRLDSTSDTILALLTDPTRADAWDRRGMVVGHVQSGKTANYVALICKAVDAGYKLIVVLAGFHNSLRSQTQIRLEEGFLGRQLDAELAATPIGVGLIDPGPVADSITTRLDNGDFNRRVAKQFGIHPGGNPLLFVVKKNASVLRNLLTWVELFTNRQDEAGMKYVQGVPLLIIDDEADQGSINTNNSAVDSSGNPDLDHDPTKINRHIRRLLHLFDQSAYVGYTATPFANIFIHENAKTTAEGEDLFPRSFIISLPTPSNHVGPSRIFGSQDEEGNLIPGIPVYREVGDHRGWMPERHNKQHIPLVDNRDELPPSLKQAMMVFVLACAARRLRGQEKQHNSMLIHVTRFTDVQNRVKDQVERVLTETRRRLRYGDGQGDQKILDELRQLWESDFAPTSSIIDERECPAHTWDEIAPHVRRAVDSVAVREINGQAGEVLDYENHRQDGLNVIAIGGDKLSRGLTLEGLTVSYFLRASKMYDTLMQMGRWFGYRPGYIDLCRLYTTRNMREWFEHITSASEELRADFNRMAASGGTPKDYGHRVRSHPLLLVTSQVKMRDGMKINFSYQGDISETVNFWRTAERTESNWQAFERIHERIASQGITVEMHGKLNPSLKWSGVKPEDVVEFLHDYTEHPASKRAKPALLADYITKELASNRLTNWTILLASGRSELTCSMDGQTVRLVQRSPYFPGSSAEERDHLLDESDHFTIKRLLSPSDEAADLTPDEFQRAADLTNEAWKADQSGRKKPTRPGGRQIREIRSSMNGLLLVYPLDPHEAKMSGDLPILGFGISFPTVDPSIASTVEYVVNNVYWQQEFVDQQVEGD